MPTGLFARSTRRCLRFLFASRPGHAFWGLATIPSTSRSLLTSRPIITMNSAAFRNISPDEFRVGDGALEISELASTRKMCAQGMDQAEAFTEALNTANQIRVIGQHLEILDEGGCLLMRLEAVALP